jgi:hypothetical protein
MTELPVKTTSPDFSAVSDKVDEYVNALQNGANTFEFKERIADLVCEAYFPTDNGEAIWRWASERIAAKEERRAANLAAADIERKSRIMQEIQDFEALRGKSVDELAKDMAVVRSERNIGQTVNSSVIRRSK